MAEQFHEDIEVERHPMESLLFRCRCNRCGLRGPWALLRTAEAERYAHRTQCSGWARETDG